MKQSPITIELREALLDDLTILEGFEQELIRYERPFAPNLKEGRISYYDIKELIQSGHSTVVVACVEGEIVGSGYVKINTAQPFYKERNYAYLGFMYVAPEYRGKGINKKIIDELIDWAKLKNITEFQLDVYAQNESALKAYSKLGFEPDLLRMRMNISK